MIWTQGFFIKTQNHHQPYIDYKRNRYKYIVLYIDYNYLDYNNYIVQYTDYNLPCYTYTLLCIVNKYFDYTYTDYKFPHYIGCVPGADCWLSLSISSDWNEPTELDTS